MSFGVHGCRTFIHLPTRGLLASEQFAFNVTLIYWHYLTAFITVVFQVLWILVQRIPVDNGSSIQDIKLRRIIKLKLLILTLLLAVVSSSVLLLAANVRKFWLRRKHWENWWLCPDFGINDLILLLLELGSYFSFTWDWNQVLYQCTSCVELILNVW